MANFESRGTYGLEEKIAIYGREKGLMVHVWVDVRTLIRIRDHAMVGAVI